MTEEIISRISNGQDFAQSLSRVKQLANANDASAIASLSLLSDFNVDISTPNLPELLERAANRGDALCSLLTSVSYSRAAEQATDPRVIEQYINRSMSFLSKASRLGMPDTVAAITTE